MNEYLFEKLRLRKLQSAAYDIVSEQFRGMVDKGGQPYEYHCLRVAEAVEQSFSEQPGAFQIKCIIAAVLHDIIEDTSITKEDLLHKGFDKDIVEAVDAVSRRKGESYFDFVKRCKENEIARTVKRYDLEDNMDIRRLTKFGDYEQKRLKKYWYSWMFIKDEIDEIEYHKQISK